MSEKRRVSFLQLELLSLNLAPRVAVTRAAASAVGIRRLSCVLRSGRRSASQSLWNKDRFLDQKRPLKPKEVSAIGVRLQLERHIRDVALFNLAIDSLRGGLS